MVLSVFMLGFFAGTSVNNYSDHKAIEEIVYITANYHERRLETGRWPNVNDVVASDLEPTGSLSNAAENRVDYWPNPWNPRTELAFELTDEGRIRFRVSDPH